MTDVGGEIKDDPITCKDLKSLCLFNTIYHAVGCCPSSAASPKECAQYTSCIPSTVSCDTDCLANDYILKWYGIYPPSPSLSCSSFQDIYVCFGDK
jgi:hypothetical protein